MVLSHGAAPSYLCYANDVTGRILPRRGTSLTFLGQAGRKDYDYIFRLCLRLLVRTLGFGQHFNLLYCVFMYMLSSCFILSQGGLNVKPYVTCHVHALKPTHLRKAFDYSFDIFNLHMEVSAPYGYMGSWETLLKA